MQLEICPHVVKLLRLLEFLRSIFQDDFMTNWQEFRIISEQLTWKNHDAKTIYYVRYVTFTR